MKFNLDDEDIEWLVKGLNSLCAAQWYDRETVIKTHALKIRLLEKAREKQEANAHLIAAAPDMYKALEITAELVEALGHTAKKARAVLAKIKEESKTK